MSTPTDPPNDETGASRPHGAADPATRTRRPPRIVAARTASAAIAEPPRFTQPVRQVVMMLVVLALVVAGGWLAYGRILPIFLANRWLNGLILAVFVLGVLACFWQVWQLINSVSWIERFAARRRAAAEKGVAARSEADGDTAPRLLAPLAAMLGARGPVGGIISTGSARSILESVATRIEELRDITRYLANLLIFLGLLGTFYGLATTIPAVVETIRALAPTEGESGIEVFSRMMTGLETQLGGMSTAFSSSLLGLAGSLVVGLLELFATHGQNRFYRELEEWMSGFTRVSLAASDGDGMDQAAMGSFIEHLATQMERLQMFHAERDTLRDEAAAMADERVVVMAEAIEALTRQVESEREATVARAVGLTQAINRMADGQERVATGQDRMLHLAEDRSAAAPDRVADLAGIESALNRIAADLSDGRAEMLADLRADILVLTRAVRAHRFGDPFREDLLDNPERQPANGVR